MSRPAYLAAAVVALTACASVAPSPERHGPAPSPVAAAPAPADGALGEPDLPDTAEDTAADAPPDAHRGAPLADSDLRARLVARARSFLGRRGPFQAAGERFNDDCSGFAQAVYAAEGIDLRGVMQRSAPRERGGVKAAWLAASAQGSVFGAEAWPDPGDLVFWHDTYDRNRNGKADDRLTHLGVVEHVEDGTVTFLHRGGKGVARGVMTLARRREASAPDGRRLNSVLRARSHPVRRGGLAAELFAGYGRIEDARLAEHGGGTAQASATPRKTATPKAAAPRKIATPKSSAKAAKASVSKKTATPKTSATAAKAPVPKKTAAPKKAAPTNVATQSE